MKSYIIILLAIILFHPLSGNNVKTWARISTKTLSISPNFDRRKDFLTITQDGSREKLWIGQFANSKGDIVRSYRWKGYPREFKWDGRSDYNRVVVDGMYNYQLGYMERGKLQVVKVIDDIKVDGSAPSVSIGGKIRYGIGDTPDFTLKIPFRENVLEKSVIVSSSKLEPIPLSSDTWNSLPDDNYTITLKVKYRNLYVAIDSFIITIRRIKPVIGLTLQKDIEYFDSLGKGHIEGLLSLTNSNDSNIENVTIKVKSNSSLIYSRDVTEALNRELFIRLENINNGNYEMELEARDDFGNIYRTNISCRFDSDLYKRGDYYTTTLDPIEFQPYEYETDIDLTDYIEILTRYKKRKVYLISNVFNDGSSKDFLSRLCSKRGSYIKKQLIKRGISRDRIFLINNSLRESNRLTYIFLK